MVAPASYSSAKPSVNDSRPIGEGEQMAKLTAVVLITVALALISNVVAAPGM